MFECTLWVRKPVVVNTDTLRRCYDGCNFSEMTIWGNWDLIGTYSRENAESSMKTFSEINPDWEYEIRV